MVERLGTLARTHTCGALTAADVGADVVLLGWVHRVRDLGALVFVDLRDRHGLTQLTARDDEALVEAAKRVRPEFVVAALGRVERRAPEAVNAKMPTGEVEVVLRELRVLSEAKTPPFQIAEDASASDETRLRYRYLDLRRPRMQQNLQLRHRVLLAVRRYFDERGFLEIETPVLTKSTPEGARDYLVPSRVHPGEFYALPQSPQIFKQILMIAGMDRYFQIVKCFRDEDLRADRQPEFTQIDVEMLVRDRGRRLRDRRGRDRRDVRSTAGREIQAPFPPHRPTPRRWRATARDKPDLRFGMPIEDLSAVFADSELRRLPRRRRRRAAPCAASPCRAARRRRARRSTALVEQAKALGAAGLAWARAPESAVQGSILKAAGEATLRAALAAAGATAPDLLLMASGGAGGRVEGARAAPPVRSPARPAG